MCTLLKFLQSFRYEVTDNFDKMKDLLFKQILMSLLCLYGVIIEMVIYASIGGLNETTQKTIT
jgi:hypothetical protein